MLMGIHPLHTQSALGSRVVFSNRYIFFLVTMDCSSNCILHCILQNGHCVSYLFLTSLPAALSGNTSITIPSNVTPLFAYFNYEFVIRGFSLLNSCVKQSPLPNARAGAGEVHHQIKLPLHEPSRLFLPIPMFAPSN